MTHRPVLPPAGQPALVVCRVHDPDGIESVTLKYREDPGLAVGTTPMSDDGNPPDALVVDSADPQGMADLCSRTKVVLTTVGPYSIYGTSLVESCVDNGTDYCDLCGEVQWMRQMIDKANGPG